MMKMKRKWITAKLMTTTNKDFFCITASDRRLDYEGIFHNQNPVYIEIGSGKGEFISQYPLVHQEWNFIGFELKQKRIDICLRKLNPDAHPNVRLAKKFIDSSISDFLPPESISGAFVQHPDPWPKRKHHKRRLFSQEFLSTLAGVLKPNAFVQISTDHSEYASWIVEEFLSNPYYSSVYDDLILENSVLDEHIVTWFEQEQKRMGFEPKFMLFKKI